MAAAAAPATPQRPLPGAFLATPAPPPTIFASNAASLRQNPAPAPAAPANASSGVPQSITPVERAGKTINDTLAQEARFPEMESYITQGISGDYDLPQSQAWIPFQRLKQYEIPSKILEQANHSGVGMMMGIFASLGHAWVSLDNSLYLWDYTLPNPEIIGYEDNPHPITGIQLLTPKPGVFVKEIEHLIVIATNYELLLLGVAVQTTSTGAKTVTLYNTKMSINVRGLSVTYIAGTKSGRIFFVGNQSDDIYEFEYQADEGWFSAKARRKCHTQSQISYLPENLKAVGQWFGTQQSKKVIKQLVIDDTRNLLYTLSNTSEIKVWMIRSDLQPALMRPLTSLLQNTGHFSLRTDLLTARDVIVASISAIPATESSKVSLMATTNTGCRLYLSVTRGYGMQADGQNPPQSMQILHIRFPPRDPDAAPPQQGQSSAVQPYGNAASSVDSTSRLLSWTESAYRFPPGYFAAFMQDSRNTDRDVVFFSALESARLKNPHDNSQLNQRFAEFGMFMELPGVVREVAAITPGDYSATSTPLGFGNELAVQFDKESTEIAIVTSAAIQTVRRRRLVDIFASIMRYGSKDEEGREGDIKRFVRTYGREETAATALAVACGQGKDVTSDARLTTITEPEVIDGARKAFIDHGGSPEYNPNALPSNGGSQIDSVRPSPRHEGLALYVSRLVRSIWKANIIRDDVKPGEAPKPVPNVNVDTLRRIQRDLSSLSEFLDRNKTFIDGLAGPQGSKRISSRQEEIAIQGEHRALHSLVTLITSVVEGISFVLALFNERLEDVLAALPEDSRNRAMILTYESLFVSDAGRDLAKELVKAIVNCNIANGSNVDTVADNLRRRCGSFCSPDDVIIFKAQEQVKRASEAGSQSETGRVLLNESQRLFQRVAASLSMEHLTWTADQYVQMEFYAGAIQLCLVVAGEKDRAKRALSWLRDDMPEPDPRKEAFEARQRCYELIFVTLEELDEQTAQAPETMDGQYTLAAKRKREAYDVVNSSDDAVFQTCLYDNYFRTEQADRLLDIDTPYVVDYLKKKSQGDRRHADLLWRYYAHHNDYLQAASVQLDLARGYFDLNLEARIEYLSHARTNASTRQTALMDSRQSKQQLLREISDLLDVANIQDDILQRMKEEPRLNGARKQEVLASLNGPILPLDELFNQYADQASYYDICILIYQVADHRNAADIKASWQSLINDTSNQARILYGSEARDWETVGEKVRELGRKLNLSDTTFPIPMLLPMLERFYMQPSPTPAPNTWVPDLFLALDVPHETLLPILEQLFYSNEEPFQGSKRRVLAAQIVYLLQSWLKESERKGERWLFGSEENAGLVLDTAANLLRGDLTAEARREAEVLVARVQRG